MKKLPVLLSILCLVLFPCLLMAESSGRLSADASVVSHGGMYQGILITPDGSTSCSIVLYDHASSASGKVIAEHTLEAGTANTGGHILSFLVPFNNGIYADVTTSGTCNFEVFFK